MSDKNMNPYETPKQSPEIPPEERPVETAQEFRPLGRPCPFCEGRNTSKDTLSRISPNILFVIFFGWIFLLIRAAFSKQTDHCRDCGEVNTYKSTGSKLAMVTLIVMVILVALIAMEP